MLYRVDSLPQTGKNPINGRKFDERWIVFQLTDSVAYRLLVGSQKNGVYSICASRVCCPEWHRAGGDFVSFHTAMNKNMLLVMNAQEQAEMEQRYVGHVYNEPLRDYEPKVLVHSTTTESWQQIQSDGMLKSWNRLSKERILREAQPIGSHLGDPIDFSDYIMFGGGVHSEIVVMSRQKGKITMNPQAEYEPGARLYFDFERIAADGLLVRDGAHMKVREMLPLKPYLLWAATMDTVGMPGKKSTPEQFSKVADTIFEEKFEVKL